MNRRENLHLLAMLGLYPLISGWTPMDDIRKRTIPSSGEKIPCIGLGTWETFDVAENAIEKPELKKVIKTLIDKGGAVVDSSPMYGYSERVVGQLSTELGINDKLFLATKVWTHGKEKGIQQMNDSLSLLKRDTIDLMQIHNLEDWKTHIKTLREWKEQGKIRYIGITHYKESAHAEIEHILNTEPIDFVQVSYNIQERKAADRVLPLAQEKKVAVLISQPFGYGKLFRQVSGKKLPTLAREIECTSWAQFFLKFILAHPAVTCIIPGTSNPAHMLDDLTAAYGKLPDDVQVKKMIQAIEG